MYDCYLIRCLHNCAKLCTCIDFFIFYLFIYFLCVGEKNSSSNCCYVLRQVCFVFFGKFTFLRITLMSLYQRFPYLRLWEVAVAAMFGDSIFLIRAQDVDKLEKIPCSKNSDTHKHPPTHKSMCSHSVNVSLSVCSVNKLDINYPSVAEMQWKSTVNCMCAMRESCIHVFISEKDRKAHSHYTDIGQSHTWRLTSTPSVQCWA